MVLEGAAEAFGEPARGAEPGEHVGGLQALDRERQRVAAAAQQVGHLVVRERLGAHAVHAHDLVADAQLSVAIRYNVQYNIIILTYDIDAGAQMNVCW